jgi:hypothetical protein
MQYAITANEETLEANGGSSGFGRRPCAVHRATTRSFFDVTKNDVNTVRKMCRSPSRCDCFIKLEIAPKTCHGGVHNQSEHTSDTGTLDYAMPTIRDRIIARVHGRQ